MKCYNVTSNSYDEQYAQEQDAKYKAAQKALNTTAYSAVLDVGCGSGLFFSNIADKAQTVVGVDVSRSLLVKAKNPSKTPRQRACCSGRRRPFTLQTIVFEAVFSFTVLQNMPNPKETLLEFKRQTTAGGKLVVTGLKKAFELTAFLDLFEAAGLKLVEFVDDDDLKCYVAIVARSLLLSI
jgi:ubiquinone/menaquinone biosynthesis C-methylase UbiE